MCLPSCDLSYFCSVSRGRNSPSINISIVISAGRPRVAFRKMSWNWFLTFISQSGWGLFLARRVFTHPTHETVLEVRGYSSSVQGLAQFLCDLIATLGKKQCANELFPLVTQVSPPHGDGWQMGMSSSFNRYVWRWEPPCLMCHVLDALLSVTSDQERFGWVDLGDADASMQLGWRLQVLDQPVWCSWISFFSLSVLCLLVHSLRCLQGSDTNSTQMLSPVLTALTCKAAQWAAAVAVPVLWVGRWSEEVISHTKSVTKQHS